MSLIERIGLFGLHRFAPEPAHRLSILALKMGAVPMPGPFTSPRIATEVAGIKMPNPVGLAAGFDKNAEVVDKLAQAGFGYVEVGAITPRPQPGNPAPRLFRLTQDKSAINRMGFNNEGMEVAAERLSRRSNELGVPVGLNLGANKDSEDRAADFVKVFRKCGPHVDFVTVNVSSPNTERLRDLQGADALRGLLKGVLAAREEAGLDTSVWLKIAPDLIDDEIVAIAEVAREVRIDAIVATNTTLDRTGLKSPHRGEAGGLSGPPLFEKSTRVLARLSQLTEGQVPLIGVGGISSVDDAWTKILAGASAVQIYTAMIYQGMSMIEEVARGLDKKVAEAGFDHISQAVGTGRGDWL